MIVSSVTTFIADSMTHIAKDARASEATQLHEERSAEDREEGRGTLDQLKNIIRNYISSKKANT